MKKTRVAYKTRAKTECLGTTCSAYQAEYIHASTDLIVVKDSGGMVPSATMPLNVLKSRMR